MYQLKGQLWDSSAIGMEKSYDIGHTKYLEHVYLRQHYLELST